MSDVDRNAYGWGEYNMEQNNYDSGQMGQGFQSFSYTPAASNQMTDAGSISMSNTPADHGRSVLRPAPMSQYQSAPSQFEEELPLLEELGINPDHILQKTMSVLNPFRSTDAEIMRDTDLAGPLCFCLAFGGFLLLSGKVHFGYIYGIGCLGCLGIYGLLNLLSVRGVGIGVVVSVLGYCLLPMVLLSSASIILSLQGFVGMFLAGFSIFWCSLSASKLFVTALDMDHQQPLIGYPCALLYGVFGLLTVF